MNTVLFEKPIQLGLLCSLLFTPRRLWDDLPHERVVLIGDHGPVYIKPWASTHGAFIL